MDIRLTESLSLTNTCCKPLPFILNQNTLIEKFVLLGKSFGERIFEKLFETAEIAKFTPEQVRSYEDSLKYYRDLKNSLDTAREEGLLEGIEKVARNLLRKGISVQIISETTGLTEQQIENLKKKI